MYEVRAQWKGHISVSAYGLQNRSMTFIYTWYWKSISYKTNFNKGSYKAIVNIPILAINKHELKKKKISKTKNSCST